jgi:O-methyltransferase
LALSVSITSNSVLKPSYERPSKATLLKLECGEEAHAFLCVVSLAAYAVRNRKVYVADSFEGLPRPSPEKFPADKGEKGHTYKTLAVSQVEVENNFRRYGLLDDQVVFLKGWFEDTLSHAPMEKLAVLRLDGDMYGSTTDALTNLYPILSRGGFCIIDDYALPGCKKAVDDFRAENGISADLKVVDWTGRYWRKE